LFKASVCPFDCACSGNRSSELHVVIRQSGAEVDRMPSSVTLHLYHVGDSNHTGLMNKYLQAMGTGAFHGGIEVYSREFSYGFMPRGTGVFDCPPMKCSGHRFWKSHPMGETTMSKAEIRDILLQLRRKWKGVEYDLLRHNCCNFCDELCAQLGVGHVPGWVTNLAAAGATLCDGVLAAATATQAAAIAAAAMAGKVDQRYRVGGAAADVEDETGQKHNDALQDGGASWLSCFARNPAQKMDIAKDGQTTWLAACFFSGRSANGGDDEEGTGGKLPPSEPISPRPGGTNDLVELM